MKLPNGYGSVHKLPGNRRKPWAVRITLSHDDNKWKYKYLGYYPDQAAALVALAHYNENPYDLNAAKTTFADVYEKWSDETYPKMSVSNIHGYKAAYKVCEKIYDVRFADLKKNHLQGVVDDCGKNYPTLKKLKLLFTCLFRYALQNDIVSKDYSQYIDIAQYKDRNPNKIDRLPFTDQDIKTMWKWSKKNEYVSIFLMMIYSGVRIGELRELKKENVHLNEQYFFIAKSKTPSGIRNVPIAKKVLPFFQYWMNKQSDCEYLIITREGRKFLDRNFRDSYWKPLIREMGMDEAHHPHDTRHTCVSLLTRAGVDERVIKKIVGHAGKSVTEQVYTHMEMQQLQEAINKI